MTARLTAYPGSTSTSASPAIARNGAAGKAAALREAVAKAQAEPDEKTVLFDRFTLNAILLARRLTARISSEERAYWRGWMKRHAAHAVDIATDNSDPVPGAIHALSEIYLGLKSLPRFMRSMPRVSPLARHHLEKEAS